MVEHKEIYEAFVAAKAEFPPVHRNAVNPYHRSRYADLSTILKAVEPVLAKHGLAIFQFAWSEPKERGVYEHVPEQSVEEFAKFTERAKDVWVQVATRLVHKSGDSIESRPLGQLVENNTQKIGAVVTYLRRYSLAGLLAIAADDDDDGNMASDVGVEPARRENETNHAGQATKLASKKQIERLYELWETCGIPVEAQNKFFHICGVQTSDELTTGQVGAAIARLKKRVEEEGLKAESIQNEPESGE